MDLSRRRVLQGLVAGAVAVASPLRWVGPAGAAPGGKGATGPSWLSRSSFVPLVGTAFIVGAGAGTTALTLTAVRDLPAQSAKDRPNASDGRFSLLFTSGAVLAQGTRAFHHDALGDTSLFAVPIGPSGTTPTYEVIVNRLA